MFWKKNHHSLLAFQVLLVFQALFILQAMSQEEDHVSSRQARYDLTPAQFDAAHSDRRLPYGSKQLPFKGSEQVVHEDVFADDLLGAAFRTSKGKRQVTPPIRSALDVLQIASIAIIDALSWKTHGYSKSEFERKYKARVLTDEDWEHAKQEYFKSQAIIAEMQQAAHPEL